MQKKTIEITYETYQFEELNVEYQQLIEKAKEQTQKAYAPYSEFKVGASVLLENGEIFAGNNQENSAYPSGLCAERVAMFYANAQFPDTPVKALAIAAYSGGRFLSEPITPCGSCRQVVLETENRFENDISIFLYGTDSIYLISSIKKLLPLCFEKSSMQR